MKKIGMYLMLVLALVATSCSSKKASEEVAQKITSGQTLDEKDYGVIIEYLGEFAEKAQPIQDKINNSDNATPALDSELAQLHSEYPLTGVFNTALEKSNEAVVGEKNVKLLEKYAPLEWFTAPSWLSVNPDSSVAGEIVEMPSTDDSAVVASSVEQLEIKK